MSTHLTTRPSKRKLLVFAIAAILLTALAWYVKNYVSLEKLADQESRFRAYISLNPWHSFAVGFGIYMGLALIPGTGGKAIVYGWLFGFWQAVTIVSVGLTLAAMAIFSLSRYLFREGGYSLRSRYIYFWSAPSLLFSGCELVIRRWTNQYSILKQAVEKQPPSF